MELKKNISLWNLKCVLLYFVHLFNKKLRNDEYNLLFKETKRKEEKYNELIVIIVSNFSKKGKIVIVVPNIFDFSRLYLNIQFVLVKVPNLP